MRKKYGFIYVWYDRSKKLYYVGSHWGHEDDGYVGSGGQGFKNAKKRRPHDFKRRIVARVYTNREDTFAEEQRWLSMIKPHELSQRRRDRHPEIRYYNYTNRVHHWAQHPEGVRTVGQKISRRNKGRDLLEGHRTPEMYEKIRLSNRKHIERMRALTGSAITEEHRQKLSESHMGLTRSEESLRKLSMSLKRAHAEGRHTGMKGKKMNEILTPEQRAEKSRKISETLRGKPLSEEHKQKIKASGFGTHWRGKTRSEETKRKMAEARRAFWQRKKLEGPVVGPNAGKKFSDESRARMRAAAAGRKRPSPEARQKMSEAQRARRIRERQEAS